MRQHHPDLRAEVGTRPGDGNDLAAAVIAAYDILRLLLAPADDAPTDKAAVYRLDAAAIDDHVLLSLFRQESTPLPGTGPS